MLVHQKLHYYMLHESDCKMEAFSFLDTLYITYITEIVFCVMSTNFVLCPGIIYVSKLIFLDYL